MLQLKISNTGISADGSTMTIQDVTGNYSVGNPGGYGAPNPAASSNVILRWKLYRSTQWVQLALVTQAGMLTGFDINTVKLGFSQVNPELLPDGVEQVQYLMGYDKGLVTPAPGSNQVNLGANAAAVLGFKYVSFTSDPNNVYGVLSIDSNGILTLDRGYEGDNTSETIRVWYFAESDILVQTFSTRVIDGRLAYLSEEELYGDTLEKLTRNTMRIFMASAKFDSKDYRGADVIMATLESNAILGQIC